MVSTQKIKFYLGRVEQIVNKRKDAVKSKYPDVEVEYRDLIASGKGTMKTEIEIRKAIKETSRYACPPTIEILNIFMLDGERKTAQKENERLSKIRLDLYKKIDLVKADAIDLVYLGTESQLLDMLKTLENIEV